jgi:putative spermidine/putrescine transport system ATP-binding protein
MSDRIAVVNHGRIMQLASPRELYEKPTNRFVADFIGDSTFLQVTRKGTQIIYADMPLKYEMPLPETSNLQLMLRPERITLATEGAAENTNNFKATAIAVVYQGDSFLLHAELQDGKQISMRGAMRGKYTSSMPAVGDQVILSIAPEDTILIDGAEQ